MTGRIESLIARLPERARQIVVLRYQEDLKPAEIAELLGIPVGAVKSNLHREQRSAPTFTGRRVAPQGNRTLSASKIAHRGPLGDITSTYSRRGRRQGPRSEVVRGCQPPRTAELADRPAECIGRDRSHQIAGLIDDV